MKNILVAVDYSDVTPALIQAAASESQSSGGKLHILHIESADPDFVGNKAGPQTQRNGVAHEMKHHHREKNLRFQSGLTKMVNCVPVSEVVQHIETPIIRPQPIFY